MVIKAELKVKVEGVRALRAALTKAAAKGLRDVADVILAESQRRVPVGASSGLKESGQVRPEKTALGADFAWTMVIYDAPYAAYVHEGTRPHFPPVDALVRWVQLVLGIHDEAEARGVAFAIARSISIHGTKPVPFLTDAIQATKPMWFTILERNFKAALGPLATHG
jgi:hypothetical protein